MTSDHCGCGSVCKRPGCALYGAGGICGKHGIYDGTRCPKCAALDERQQS